MPQLIVSDDALKQASKDDSVLVGRIQRHISNRTDPKDIGRPDDIIHPSELCRDDFCPRAVYYRIAGYPIINADKRHSFYLLQIFQEGTDIHTKWQKYLWEMGELVGMFGCLVCQALVEEKITDQWKWWARAPQNCRFCGADYRFLTYLEVPIRDDEHLIHGHSDGRVGTDLLEIKSIAKGTIRVEAPELYKRYSKTVTYEGEQIAWLDLEGLWRGIKRPLMSHLRQGQLYLHATGLDRIIFILECKWNQQHKEFVVRYTPSILEPLFDMCLDIKWALKTNHAPPCPHHGCAYCRSYEGANGAPADRGHLTDAGRGDPRGQSRAGEERLPGAEPAHLRPAPPAPPADRPGRRRPNGAVHAADSVVGPHRRTVGAPRGRREVRRLGL